MKRIFREIVKSPIVDIKQTLEKIYRFTDVELKPMNERDEKKKHFVPKFFKFEIVHCDFVGTGYEWDGPHYGVVWDISPHFDSVMIIPTTSQPREEYIDVFSANQIKGLPKGDTYLLIPDMTRVSRKKMKKITYYHEKFGETNPRLPKYCEERVLDAIATRYMNAKVFEDIVSYDCGIAMVDGLRIFRELRFKAVSEFNYDVKKCELSYRLLDKVKWEVVQLKIPNTGCKIKKQEKAAHIRLLASIDPAKKSKGEEFFRKKYGIL